MCQFDHKKFKKKPINFKPVGMADVPLLVLKEIFDHLSIGERLKVRCVCKTWKFVIEAFNRPQSLCIYSTRYPSGERWCLADQKVKEVEMLHLRFNDDLDAPRPSLSLDFFQNLRMGFFQDLQKVYLYQWSTHFLEELNQLTKLKVLMINDLFLTKPITWNFPRLEKLSIRPSYGLLSDGKVGIQLNTPNLNSFVYHVYDLPMNVINLLFPLKVKYVQCFEFCRMLNELKNLETLVCQRITFDFELNNFRSLTRLEIWPTEDQLPMVRQIREERDLLKRNDLQLICSGFKDELISCAREPPSEEIELTSAYLQEIERNRAQFEGCPWKTSISLTTIVRCLNQITDRLLDCLPNFNKIYSNLPIILPNGVLQSRLIEVIQKSHPSDLSIPDSLNLTKESFIQLTRIESLKNLKIEINLNDFSFDCLLNLKVLETLDIQSPTISTEFLCKMVRQMKHLSEFYFHSSSQFNITIHFNELVVSSNRWPCAYRYHLGYRYKKNPSDVFTPYLHSKDYTQISQMVRDIRRMAEAHPTSFV